jgi:hypothetical protein
MTRHLVIPDTQVGPDTPQEHFDWIGRAILEYRPDTIIHLGDHWDMGSLSSYAGRPELENRRYQADVESGNEAMQRLLTPLRAYNKRKRYRPRKVFLFGNHEDRVDRAINENPIWERAIGYQDLNLEGWETFPFKQPVEIDGILYCHYFYSVNSGRAYGGTTHNKLKNIGLSFTMGHQQGLDYAMRQLPNGRRQYGLVAGTCYLHDEDYRGPQANGEWRGIIVKNDVKAGEYDIMPLSLKYLKERFG